MADQVRRQLDNYHLIRLLGNGGFGEVYLAEHHYRHTQVAIKILPPLVQNDLQSFLTEARIFRLKHPNIVQVLDFGIEGRTPFIVMEYAALGTLRQRHPKGTRLPLPQVVSYVKQVSSALQYAHEERLIHRDVKPENMLIGAENQILLSDFGIATIAHGTSSQSVEAMAGTIAYMAPEQIQGHPRQASDQYSLGVVIYEWLCGDRPFHGTLTEIAVQHAMAPPPSLHEKVTAIPPDVERVVMTALAKDPKQRFDNVQALAQALEQASQLKQPEPKPTFPVSDTTDASQSQPPMTLTAPLTHDWPMSEIPVSPSIQSQDLVSGSSKEGSGVASVPLSSPSPQPAQRQVSRRIMVLGLGLAGLFVTGGGITWSLLTTSNGKGYNSSGTATTGGNFITGQIASVNAQAHSVTLVVDGQQFTLNGLTDQQIALLQSQINQTYTFQLRQPVQSGTTTYTINQNTQTQEASNGTSTPVSNQKSAPVPGSIEFVGKVQSVNGSNVVVSTPDGQNLTINIVTGQTDTSNMNGMQISPGQVIKVKASTDLNGNFVAVMVGIDQPIDQQQDMSTVQYEGVTTSAVGADNRINFKVGNNTYSFPIGTGANQKDFNNNAKSICNNVQVQVKVIFNGTNGTIVKVSNPNGSVF